MTKEQALYQIRGGSLKGVTIRDLKIVGECVEIRNSFLTNCDLSELTNSVIVDNIMIECILPPYEVLLSVDLNTQEVTYGKEKN